ncbi:MAG: methyltransferase domain-containing protein [Acidobacteriota bacterium]
MTPYEYARLLATPFLPALYSRVHRDLRRLCASPGRARSEVPSLLDVGGRGSPYTVGLGARVTVLDVPRESDVQATLKLGLSDDLLARLRSRRSNVDGVVVEDMCTCTLEDASFDGAVSVEVIEHVERDDLFVEQIARVLRPGGFAYFTTPNGDYVKNEPPNYNPDHVRHYLRAELEEVLLRHFDEVQVVYGVKTGIHRYRGLRSFDPRRPIQLAVSMASNVVSQLESRGLDGQSRRTAHLFAVARKAGSP